MRGAAQARRVTTATLGSMLAFAGLVIGLWTAASASSKSNFICFGVGQSIPPGTYGSVAVTGLCSIAGTVNISSRLTVAAGAGLDARLNPIGLPSSKGPPTPPKVGLRWIGSVDAAAANWCNRLGTAECETEEELCR